MNGSWLPASEAKLENNDIGFLQSAVIVERLRTFKTSVPYISEHLTRFQRSCTAIGIELTHDEQTLRSLVLEVAKKNCPSESEDISIVLIASPGVTDGLKPTLICMPSVLPWQRLAAFYSHGQELLITDIQNVPPSSWSPQIKTRSRLHYYLADRDARQKTGNPNCSGIVIDPAGNILDTSISNVAMLEGDRLIYPPDELLLPGLSQARMLKIAEQILPTESICKETISAERLRAAETIILSGTTGCMWYASSVDGRVIKQPTENSIAMKIRQRWIEELEFNFVSQAVERVQ